MRDELKRLLSDELKSLMFWGVVVNACLGVCLVAASYLFFHLIKVHL